MTDLPKLIALKDAAVQLGVTISALRAEVQRGNLVVRRIGKNFYTTTRDLDAMVDLCRVKPSPLVSSSESREEENGSSATESGISELDALRASMTELSKPSARTSFRDRRKPQAEVVELHPSR